MTTDKHPTRIYLDPPLMDWLRTEADRRHCSVSQVVRDLIVDRIEKGRLTPQPVQEGGAL